MKNLQIITSYLESIEHISNVKLSSNDKNFQSISFTCSETRVWNGTLTVRRQGWRKYYITLFDSTTDYSEGKIVRNPKQIIEFLKYQYID